MLSVDIHNARATHYKYCMVTVAGLLLVRVQGRKDVVTKTLYKYLLEDSNYEPDLLPVCDYGGFVNISLNIALRQIVSLVGYHNFVIFVINFRAIAASRQLHFIHLLRYQDIKIVIYKYVVMSNSVYMYIHTSTNLLK